MEELDDQQKILKLDTFLFLDHDDGLEKTVINALTCQNKPNTFFTKRFIEYNLYNVHKKKQKELKFFSANVHYISQI